MRRVGSMQRGLQFTRKTKLSPLNARVHGGGAYTPDLPGVPRWKAFHEGLNYVHPAVLVLEKWVLGTAQRNRSHPLHPNKSSPLLHNPHSYTDTEGARDYSTQITRQLLLLSPSLQGLHKPSSTGNAPCRAPFSTYAHKASVHTSEASLTQKTQTAINTSLVPPVQFGTFVPCLGGYEEFEYLLPWIC